EKIESRQQEVLVLTALAKTNLGTSTAGQMYERLPELIELTRNGADARMRAKAGRAAVFLLGITRHKEAMEELLVVVDSIPKSDLDLDSVGHLVLARSILLYHLRRTSESWTQVNEGIDELRRRGAADLVMVQLHLGLGSITSAQGKYADAVVSHETALQMALRLGNNSQAASIAGNLGLCYSRLGRHQDQLQLVSKIPLPTGPDFLGFVEMQYAYSTAISHIALGRSDKACEVLRGLDSRLLGEIPPWMIQAWRLWGADVLLLARKTGDANASGHAATTGFSNRLLSNSFAGPFARWIALTNKTSPDSQPALALVQSLADRLQDFDAIDQAGVLVALRILEKARHGGTAGLTEKIRAKMQLLPRAVGNQLLILEDPSYVP
ncbi:MAG: tetratricopeptide repeat protein, partial [Gemmatimonadales bacterium]